MAQTLYTAKELASLLKLNPQTIYRLAEKGEIESVKVGKARRFLMPSNIPTEVEDKTIAR